MQLSKSILHLLGRLSWLNLVLFGLFTALTPILTYVLPQPFLCSLPLRTLFFFCMAVMGAVFLKAWRENRGPGTRGGWGIALACSLLLSGSLHILLAYIPEISNNPFTLSWSEASRYYYASLYFSRRIYGVQVPPTVLHPSRYLMQAMPFLLSNSPIWLHRAWQVLLWNVAPLLTAQVLAHRLKMPNRLTHWLFIGFVFSYLMIGPVYYHLLVPVILVVWGFRAASAHASRRDFLLSALVIFVASAWSGISRINWYPVPGCIAATLILLQRPISPQGYLRLTDHWRVIGAYILRLAGWIVFGAAVAFGSQVVYIVWSGNSAEQFTTSLTSSLLWHRLLPNPTYPPGILLAIAIVSLPVLLVIASRLFSQPANLAGWRRYHWVRLAGLAGVLAVFFVGGVIVSLKIGGGSNLHNLDAFMVLLLIIGAYFYFDRAPMDLPVSSLDLQPDIQGQKTPNIWFSPRKIMHIGVGLGLLVSVTAAIVTRAPVAPLPGPQVTAENLRQISKAVKQVREAGGSVLFLSNRQLLTFHEIDAPLVLDYERVFLMETAMANDPAYMEKFHKQLEQQDFALIISEPLSHEMKGPKDDFGAESNAWVKQVSNYVLCYYKSTKTLRDVQVQLLTPSPDPKEKCP